MLIKRATTIYLGFTQPLNEAYFIIATINQDTAQCSRSQLRRFGWRILFWCIQFKKEVFKLNLFVLLYDEHFKVEKCTSFVFHQTTEPVLEKWRLRFRNTEPITQNCWLHIYLINCPKTSGLAKPEACPENCWNPLLQVSKKTPSFWDLRIQTPMCNLKLSFYTTKKF